MYNRGQISPERGDDGEKDTAVEGACTAKRGPRSDVSCSYVAQACSSSALIVSGGSLREALVSILRISLFAPVMMMVGRRTQLSDQVQSNEKWAQESRKGMASGAVSFERVWGDGRNNGKVRMTSGVSS